MAQSTNGVMSSAISLPLEPHFYWAGLVLYAINQYCAHSFTRNWQLPFLNQWKGENDLVLRKYFMISLHEKRFMTQQGSNLQPPDHHLDTHPTETPRWLLTVESQCTCMYYRRHQLTPKSLLTLCGCAGGHQHNLSSNYLTRLIFLPKAHKTVH